MNTGLTDGYTDQPLILFDGVCNLCNNCVQFVVKRERREYFRFASLQSEVGRFLSGNAEQADLSAIVLIEKGRYYRKSAAVLRISLKLNSLWPVLYCFILIPGPLRDLIYDYVGNRRYRWFGRTESCWIPSGDLGRRFANNMADIE